MKDLNFLVYQKQTVGLNEIVHYQIKNLFYQRSLTLLLYMRVSPVLGWGEVKGGVVCLFGMRGLNSLITVTYSISSK